ncbi:MAG: hypothetical protein Q8P99_01850 [bacterium]|nr:hypothetical protein [bacterium]MDZ4231603.1 hypothetical protein [Patescibacteria group bacterium]
MFSKKIEEYGAKVSAREEAIKQSREIAGLQESSVMEGLVNVVQAGLFADGPRGSFNPGRRQRIGALDLEKGKASWGIFPLEGESGITDVHLEIERTDGKVIAYRDEDRGERARPGAFLVRERLTTRTSNEEKVIDEFKLGKVVGWDEENNHLIVQNPDWVEGTDSPETPQYLDPGSDAYQVLLNHLQLFVVSAKHEYSIEPVAAELDYLEKMLSSGSLDLEGITERVDRITGDLEDGIAFVRDTYLPETIKSLQMQLAALQKGDLEEVDKLNAEIASRESEAETTLRAAGGKPVAVLLSRSDDLKETIVTLEQVPDKRKELEEKIADVKRRLAEIDPRV